MTCRRRAGRGRRRRSDSGRSRPLSFLAQGIACADLLPRLRERGIPRILTGDSQPTPLQGWSRGQDSNLGTPARADLESAAFGRSATPALSTRGADGPYSSSVSSSTRSPSSEIGMESAPSSRRSSRDPASGGVGLDTATLREGVLRWRPHLRHVRTRIPDRSRVRTVRPSTQNAEQERQYNSRYSRRSRTLYRIPIRRAKATYRSASSG